MKEVRQAFRFQLIRSKRIKHLDRTINVAAQIWNKAIALHRRYYKLFKKSLKQSQLQRHLAKLRRTRFKHWMLVDSQAVQAVTDRLYRAWGAWFKHQIKRPPTFRALRKYKSFTLKQSGWKLLGPGRVRIQGRIYRFHQCREILGTVKTVTVSRDKTGRYFVSFSCEEVPSPEPRVKTGQTTGADFGLKTFLTLSDGSEIHAPLPLKKSLHKVRSLHRRLSRKQKGSHSHRKARLALAKARLRVKNQRSNWHWQVATKLVKQFDRLAFEDLNLRGMKALWGRKVSDLGFADFLSKQIWLAEKYGKELKQSPRFDPTSQRLFCCKHKQPAPLEFRTIVCQKCGRVWPRDQSAALNIEESCFADSGQEPILDLVKRQSALVTAESHALQAWERVNI